MADIRNDQFLHRPGAGRGAITPADPLEVLLYDGSGNPLLAKTPTGETRQALGVAGYGYDGTNWRPVKVNASGQAEVQLTGSNVLIAYAEGITITAGATVQNAIPVQDVSEFVWLYIQFFPGGLGKYEIIHYPYRATSTISRVMGFTVMTRESITNTVSDPFRPRAPRCSFGIRNLTDHDATIDAIYLCGLKA